MERKGEGFHARRPMEREGEDSHAQRPMERKRKVSHFTSSHFPPK